MAPDEPGQVEFRVEQPGEVKLVPYEHGQAEFHMEQPGEVEMAPDEPRQAEFRVEQPGEVELVPDEPGQAEFCVEQPGEVELVPDEPVQVEFRVEQPGEAEEEGNVVEQAATGLDEARNDAQVAQQPPGTVGYRRGGPRIHGRGVRGVRVHGGGTRHHTQVPRVARNILNQPVAFGPHLPGDGMQFQWNRVYPRGLYRPRHVNFTGRERILQPLPRSPTALDFFKLYITDEIIDHLVTHTNMYAAQYIQRVGANLRPNSTVHEWVPTNRAEMLTLLGVLLLMGVVHKPRMTMYWSKDDLLATPVFNQVMRRDRFLLLIKFLHFADNSTYNHNDPGRDKLFKLREVMNLMRRRCSSVYSPGKNLSMDESLVLFKGRLSFKQYISSKRSRFGIKLYQLCTANGILLDFLVYHGNMQAELLESNQASLLTEKIPTTLMQQYLNKGHHLFIDNYYTSLPLAKFLLDNETYVTGTIRDNRKHFPLELKSVILEK